MIQCAEFKTNRAAKDSLQGKLGEDVQEIRPKKIYIKADKTTNHYKAEPQDYLTILEKNVSKAYKKTCKQKLDTSTAEGFFFLFLLSCYYVFPGFVRPRNQKQVLTENKSCRRFVR